MKTHRQYLQSLQIPPPPPMTTPPDLPHQFLAMTVDELKANALILGTLSHNFTMPAFGDIPKENEKPKLIDTMEGNGPFIILGCLYRAEYVAEFLERSTPHKLAQAIAAVWLKALAGMVSEISVGIGKFPDVTLGIVHDWPDPNGATYGLHWVKQENGELIGIMCRVGVWLAVKGWRYTPDPDGDHLQFQLKEAWKPE